ncbi:MAG: hypothetical protein CMN78_06065 [Spirochaetales bacterium]|nr:hypothetical protein [Spirochaetales bacterium]
MTMKERILAVVRGEPVDRVPFVMYEGLLPVAEVSAHLGSERIGLMRWSSIHKVEHSECRFESEDFDRGGTRWRRNTIHTPAGAIFEERAFEPEYNSSSIRKHFVEKPDDYEALWALLEDGQIKADYERYNRDAEDLGDRGIPLVAIQRSPYQQLWVQWVGLEALGYHFVDCPQKVAKTVEILEELARQIFDIAVDSPAPFIDFPDNITAPAIGPARFEKYCVPLYRDLAEKLAPSGRPVFVHMDGDLKPLWEKISISGVRGLDSFSPAPDNDTTIEDVIRLWPDMRIFMNFPSSVHLRPPDEIRRETFRILEVAASTGNLQIQLSENVPHRVWRTSLPAIAGAIEEFCG